ncbi:molybdopterin converting factor subunit 1 [Pseudogulbenkiania sp. MAI-1]|uniref:molybdopterin converting factor subunit 1 n=1 Tax=Pseudogulbenkiania sp. MAI-1 TaxID=990370 RepID=UPI00045E75A7|nr:molybdopterin converting factor subunit 1 [Pseudogulbenkiania sp. MAI-1]
MKLKLLYFARLKDAFGRDAETLDSEAATVAALLAELRARGGAWAEELAEGRVFRVAVNQELAAPQAALAAGDEVAIFPPVTGG